MKDEDLKNFFSYKDFFENILFYFFAAQILRSKKSQIKRSRIFLCGYPMLLNFHRTVCKYNLHQLSSYFKSYLHLLACFYIHYLHLNDLF